ncbi:hypothetical protein [Spongiibacter tropicus]|uniref:hypothetical protein n=1 Tax=Spongiibacter tropicus TaxID=454602 RepID=UPI0024E19BF9|nr:hypothetical protein [Spongiibacter tropicus]
MSDRDGLKPLTELCTVDIRNTWHVCINRQTGEQRPVTVEDHYAEIELYPLHEQVPDRIATQYDVSRNLYLYAWFEYRFFNIAEAQVLTVLELAMKERIGEENIKRYIKQRNDEHKAKTGKKGGLRNGMKTLMEYCRDHQLIRNEGFSAWRRHATQMAYNKAEAEQLKWAEEEMERTGKTEIELPEIVIDKLPPDPNYDHVQRLVDNVNQMRNHYSHGSTMLHNQVLGRFEMVSEFINQLFEDHALTKEKVH